MTELFGVKVLLSQETAILKIFLFENNHAINPTISI